MAPYIFGERTNSFDTKVAETLQKKENFIQFNVSIQFCKKLNTLIAIILLANFDPLILLSF